MKRKTATEAARRPDDFPRVRAFLPDSRPGRAEQVLFWAVAVASAAAVFYGGQVTTQLSRHLPEFAVFMRHLTGLA